VGARLVWDRWERREEREGVCCGCGETTRTGSWGQDVGEASWNRWRLRSGGVTVPGWSDLRVLRPTRGLSLSLVTVMAKVCFRMVRFSRGETIARARHPFSTCHATVLDIVTVM